MDRNKSIFSPFLRQCFVTVAICINSVGQGCGIGYPAVLLPQLKNQTSAIQLNAETASWIAAVSGPALLVGNFLTPSIMGKFGRKPAIYAVTLPAMIGWFTMVMAENYPVILFCRILQGVSFGMILPLRSIMLGEYTSPKNRGAYLATIAWAQAFGIFFVHLIGVILSWQQTALVVTFFFFICLVMVIYIPESPSFLASKGKYDKCRKSFHWLRGNEENEELEDMIETCLLIEKHKIQDHSNKSRYFRNLMDIISKKEFYKPIVVMIHAYIMAQFSGGGTMANYPIQIIGTLMGPTANVNFWMLFLDAQRLVTGLFGIYIINRLKRRTMLFSVGSISVFAHLTIAAYVYMNSNGMLKDYNLSWLPAILLNLKVLAIATAMVPLPNVIAGEVFPLEYRSICGAISLICLALSIFVQLKTFPPMVENIGLEGTYLSYAGVLTYCLVVLWFLLPETKGKTLQQIEDGFRGRPLKPTEIEVRKSLQSDPLYRRNMSVRKCSISSNIVA